MKVEYTEGSDTFEAVVESPQSKEKLPAVMVFHAWGGRDAFAEEKAKYLASLGYVGVAADLYGKGKLGETTEEKTALMTPLMEDRDLLQRRIQAALQMTRSLENVDPARIGAIGFCFGGLAALDLARSGSDVRGVVSFHGLFIPLQKKGGEIKARLLALHGYDDPMATPEQMKAFMDEMTEVKADWQCLAFGNTKHAFTNPEANDPKMGTVYQPSSEKRALLSMTHFLKEIF